MRVKEYLTSTSNKYSQPCVSSHFYLTATCNYRSIFFDHSNGNTKICYAYRALFKNARMKERKKQRKKEKDEKKETCAQSASKPNTKRINLWGTDQTPLFKCLHHVIYESAFTPSESGPVSGIVNSRSIANLVSFDHIGTRHLIFYLG